MNQPPVTSQPQYVMYPPAFQPQPQPPQPQQQIINQPQMSTTCNINIGSQNNKAKRDWYTGKMGCFDDCFGCCLVLLCPSCYIFYLTILFEENFCVPIVVPQALLALRIRFRSVHGIKGSILGDCCATTCCPLCVMCQMKREHELIKKTTDRASPYV